LTYTKNNGIDSYTKNNRINSYILGDSVCTKKNKTHLYWNWTSANIQDLNPTMLMYILVWFIPALLSNRHRNTSFIIIITFIIAYIAALYKNELFTLPSLWCYFSVPIVLLIIYKPQFTWPGLIITLLGIPLYYLAVRNKNSTS
jgi:hypothetical protein